MEESCEFVCLRIIACNVWAFVSVAVVASPGAILRIVGAVMFLGDDMFHLKRKVVKFLRKMAILAPVTCPVLNEMSKGVTHWNIADYLASERRAFALIMLRKL